MFRFNALLFLAFLLVSAQAFACSCSPSPLTTRFQESQFVAKVKFLDIRQDPADEDYHNARIQILALYKGVAVTEIKIHSQLMSSCAFLPEVNSTWIIFAAEWQGKLSFHFCSGSFDLGRTFNNSRYPEAEKNYRDETQLKEQVLEFFRIHHITDPNTSRLNISMKGLDSLTGFKNTNRFAVFQLNTNTDLSISKITSLRRFRNNMLHKVVLNIIENSEVSVALPEGKTPTQPSQVIVVVYFYPQRNPEQNFLTMYDL